MSITIGVIIVGDGYAALPPTRPVATADPVAYDNRKRADQSGATVPRSLHHV